MTAASPQRPPLLVAVCSYIGLACAIQCLIAVSAVSAWTSIDGQTSRRPLIDALVRSGLSRGTAETSYRSFLIVTAGVAAMCVVLAFYTARSQRVSRAVLTVLATVVAAFGATGPFLSQALAIFLLACIAQLWSGDIRRHFRGEAPAVRASRPVRIAVPASPTPPVASASPTPPVASASHATARAALPQPVRIAAWTGLIGSLVVTGSCALFLLVFAVVGGDYDQVMRDSPRTAALVRDSGMDVDTLFRISTIVAAVCLALGLVGMIASIALLAGRREGGMALIVMAAVSAVVSIVGFPVGLPWTIAAIVVIIQLRKLESRAWFTKT